MRYSFLLVLALFTISSSVHAENLPANNCEIFIKSVAGSPGSHGTATMDLVLKTNISNQGEYIQNVGFYGQVDTKDFGNVKDCHWTTNYSTAWSKYPQKLNPNTKEATFHIFLKTGSVSSDCLGFQYSWTGTFYVETNKNTYWLNPDMDSSKHFTLDMKAMEINIEKGGWSYNPILTNRADMKYYNPISCN